MQSQVYVLHDPVEETWAADHSFVRRWAKARQPDSDRLVWIKQVKVQRSTPEAGETCKVLKVEGQLLGKLERLPDFPRLSAVVGNENVVTVVYSYTDGPNLSQVFGAPGQPLDSHRAYRLLRSLLPLCIMLGELHRLAVSHRHLNPEEIVLLPGRHDHAVLRDIGLAAQPVVHQEGPALYRAPEQARKTLQPPGPATDIYQIAAVLYHFLTGRLPAAFLGQVEAPSIFNRDLPPALDEALLRALAQEPTNRWSGIRDFQRALDQAARQLRDQLRGMS